jgi:hypothetical protein
MKIMSTSDSLLRAGTVIAVLVMPVFAFATSTIQDLLRIMGSIINLMTPIVVALALLAFFWGLAMYLFEVGGGTSAQTHSMFGAPATPAKRDGRSIMIMGIFVFFVMVSIWGLVNVLQNTFKIYQGDITPPSINNPYD